MIERNERSTERASRDQVTIAPATRSAKQLAEDTRPMTDDELIPDSYSVDEQTNLRDIALAKPATRNNGRRQPAIAETVNGNIARYEAEREYNLRPTIVEMDTATIPDKVGAIELSDERVKEDGINVGEENTKPSTETE